METRARYVLIGLFAFIIIMVGFGFVYWMNNVGGLGARTDYRVRFDTPVPGLLLGSAVSFNGIQVGEVTGLGLDPEDPRAVVVKIAVRSTTPVRNDTKVALSFGGLTGSATIALTGGSPDAPALAAADGQPAQLASDSGSTLDWTSAARNAFSRVDAVLQENRESLKNAVASIDTFAGALARNAGKVDGIVAGLEKMTGANAPSIVTTYDLDAATDFPADLPKPDIQLTVQQPSALVGFDTQRFVQRDGTATTLVFDDSKWSDSIPLMFRTKIVRSFENAGFAKVSGDQQDLSSDNKLLVDIRAFDVTAGADPVAEVEFSAKLANRDDIQATRMFKATAPVSAMDGKTVAAAMNQAFGEALAGLVAWALPELRNAPAGKKGDDDLPLPTGEPDMPGAAASPDAGAPPAAPEAPKP